MHYKLNQYVGVQVLSRGMACPVVINYYQAAAYFAKQRLALDVEAIFLPAQMERNQLDCILMLAGSIVPDIAYKVGLSFKAASQQVPSVHTRQPVRAQNRS